MARRDYELLWPSRHSLFIDQIFECYRCEFMINYKQTMPQYFWEKATFEQLFDDKNEFSTFMLLDNTCEYEAPVGIDKRTKSIVLNDNSTMSWKTFKQSMFNNEITKYQNLDFKGNNYLMTIDTIDNNFKPPCQQIANVDLEKLKDSVILSYFIGQYTRFSP